LSNRVVLNRFIGLIVWWQRKENWYVIRTSPVLDPQLS
jgi:hypothetical protein